MSNTLAAHQRRQPKVAAVYEVESADANRLNQPLSSAGRLRSLQGSTRYSRSQVPKPETAEHLQGDLPCKRERKTRTAALYATASQCFNSCKGTLHAEATLPGMLQWLFLEAWSYCPLAAEMKNL